MADYLQQSDNVSTERAMATSYTLSPQELSKNSDKNSTDAEALKIAGTIQALEQMSDFVSGDAPFTDELEARASSYTISDGNSKGGSYGSSSGSQTTISTDENGNTVETVTLANGDTTVTTTDPEGNTVSVVTTTTDPSTGAKTVSSTDQYGNTSVTVTNKDGSSTCTTTTKSGPYNDTTTVVVTSTDANGATTTTSTSTTTTTTKDAQGNVTGTTTTVTAVDASGNTTTTVTTKDQSGNTTSTVVTTTSKNGTTTTTTTAADGTVTVNGTDENGDATTTVTDANGNVTVTTTGKAETSTDENGNVITTQTITVTTTDKDGNTTTTETTTTTEEEAQSGYTTVITDTKTTDQNGTVTETTTTVSTDENGNVVYTCTDTNDASEHGFSTSSGGCHIMGGNSVGVAIASLNHAQDMMLEVDLAWLEQNRLTFEQGTQKAQQSLDLSLDAADKQQDASYFEAYGMFAAGGAAGAGAVGTMYSSREALKTMNTENSNIDQQQQRLQLLKTAEGTHPEGLGATNDPSVQHHADVRADRFKNIRAYVESGNNGEQVVKPADYPKIWRGANGKTLDEDNNEIPQLTDNQGYLIRQHGTDPIDGSPIMRQVNIHDQPANEYGQAVNERGEIIGGGEIYNLKRIHNESHMINPDGSNGKRIRSVTYKEATEGLDRTDFGGDIHDPAVASKYRFGSQNLAERPENSEWSTWTPFTRQGHQAAEATGFRSPDIVQRQSVFTRVGNSTARTGNWMKNGLGYHTDPNAGVNKTIRLNYNHQDVIDAYSDEGLAASGVTSPRDYRANLKQQTEADLKNSTEARDRAAQTFSGNASWYNTVCTAFGGNILQGLFKIMSADEAYTSQQESATARFLEAQGNQLYGQASNWQGQASKAYDQSLSILSGPLDALRRAVSRG